MKISLFLFFLKRLARASEPNNLRMGAGSSARKLKEVEERMEAEAVARRKIEQELLETRRELERLRESMATTKVINMHTAKAMRWKPCRVKKNDKNCKCGVVAHEGAGVS